MSIQITSYNRFFKALEYLVDDKGFDFELVECQAPVRRFDGKWVYAHMIIHRTDNGGHLSPIQLVHIKLVGKNDKPQDWVESVILEKWGFQEKGYEIRQACHETGYHDRELRERILRVCGIEEVDHMKRRLMFKE